MRPAQWMCLATGHGTKGRREYDWAWLDIRADDAPAGQDAGTSVLVARRHRYNGEVSYFRCWAPGPLTLATLVEIICRRWRIEETFQRAKGHAGLDQGQVTGHRHRLPSMTPPAAGRSMTITTAAVSVMRGILLHWRNKVIR
ncbi:hypothetical protein ACFCVY_18725 [Streptomyces sp. NPDC056411]|uniref:hypothetical protein n=1 Tax=Streptomyces sp. NPDC056411 TaxID=3345813 RepID=UPI0035E12288